MKISQILFTYRECVTIVTTSTVGTVLPMLALTQTDLFTQRESARTAT